MIIDNDAINRAKLRVDARKWVAARLAPKKYGDRLQTENHTTHDVSDNLTALMAEINGTSRTK